MAKRLKPKNMHEALALRLLRAARRMRLTFVTDEELLEGIRSKNAPPSPPPASVPTRLTGPEWEALLNVFAQFAGARINAREAAYRGNATAQGASGAFPGGFPFPGQVPPQIPSAAPRVVPWRVILGIPQDKAVTAADVHARWKLLATVYHPDTGGSKEAFQAITDARDYAIRELGAR